MFFQGALDVNVLDAQDVAKEIAQRSVGPTQDTRASFQQFAPQRCFRFWKVNFDAFGRVVAVLVDVVDERIGSFLGPNQRSNANHDERGRQHERSDRDVFQKVHRASRGKWCDLTCSSS